MRGPVRCELKLLAVLFLAVLAAPSRVLTQERVLAQEAGARQSAEQPKAAGNPSDQAAKPQAKNKEYVVRRVRGRVVWLADALEKRWGVKVVTEAKKRVLALEADNGQLLTLVEDLRARAFRNDPRLRKMHVELEVRQYSGTNLARIIRVFEIQKDRAFAIDYWCDICSIAHFELMVCACCQGPLELRKTPVKLVNRSSEK